MVLWAEEIITKGLNTDSYMYVVYRRVSNWEKEHVQLYMMNLQSHDAKLQMKFGLHYLQNGSKGFYKGYDICYPLAAK